MWNEASAKPCTRILFLQLLLGVLLLGGVFLLAVNEDIAATQRTMVNTVNYVKEQCNRYSRIGLADESKSLMRIVESANQTAHRLEETTRPVSADFLHTCMKDCYVSGILLLDEAGNITAASEAADMAAFVHENLDSEALQNTDKGNQHIPKQFSGEKHAQKAVEHLLWCRQKVGTKNLCAAKQKPNRKQDKDAEKRRKCRMYFYHIILL